MTDATPKQVEPESEVSKQVDTIRTWATKLVPVAFTVASAIAAYAGAGATANTKAGEAKDKSEAGYQSVEKWVKHLEETDRVLVDRVAKLEAELTDLRRRVRMTTRRLPEPPKPAPVPMAAVAVPPAPPPLPANLDKALEQQQAKGEAGK